PCGWSWSPRRAADGRAERCWRSCREVRLRPLWPLSPGESARRDCTAARETLARVTDVVLVGAGIMSATLGVLLRKLDPALTIAVCERLDRAAAESSDAWNNAGTGHSGFCELNYTPPRADGSVDVSRAVRVAEQFELSRQFWASLVESGDLPAP